MKGTAMLGMLEEEIIIDAVKVCDLIGIDIFIMLFRIMPFEYIITS